MRVISTLVLCLIVGALQRVEGFSLLGPLKNRTNDAPDPWQGKPYGGLTGGLGYELKGDIGGPMFASEAYRWNLPVIYYGFDKSFVDYFGQPGIDAVEDAIEILNALPPASEMSTDLLEFPLDTEGENPSAAALNLLDMKSCALALLLEQLGLANPGRFVWALRDRQVAHVNDREVTNYAVLNLNFDPETIRPTRWVNGVGYNYQVVEPVMGGGVEWASAVEWFQLDPLHQPYNTVAGALGSPDLQFGASPQTHFIPGLSVGEYFDGLTRDDVGGLRYLFSNQNRVVEPLPLGITSVGNNAQFVNVALRGGVEKLSFARLLLDGLSGEFLPVTNVFSDIFYTNQAASTQTLSRVVAYPDIVFRAQDLGGEVYRSPHHPYLFLGLNPSERSDTSKWINNAGLNQRSSGGGPGVIPPGASIAFNKLGRYLGSSWEWGSFDGSGDSPRLHLGSETNQSSLVVETRVTRTNDTVYFHWTTLFQRGEHFRMEATTNFIDWETLGVIDTWLPDSGLVEWSVPVGERQRFFRAVKIPHPP